MLFEEILFGMNHEVNIDVKVTCKSGQFLTLSEKTKKEPIYSNMSMDSQ